MNVPSNLRYSKKHEWTSAEGEQATVGITNFAQSELGDIVFVELPKIGDSFKKEMSFGSLESVKAVSEAYMPVSGRILAVNEDLLESPEKINADPYGEGWMIRIHLDTRQELDELMSAAQYLKYIQEESKD